ncbi:MAG: PilC/PilY family type IV pilus protein [Methylococcales bacterium]
MKKILTSSFLFLYSSFVLAANYQIAPSPLFLGNSVEPNIFFMLDDSGSMDFEIMTKKYWHYCAYDPDSGSHNNSSWDCGSEITTGLVTIYNGSDWDDFYYIFDNTDDAYGNHCNTSLWDWFGTVELCASSDMDEEWRVKSSAVNVLYYNPAVTYSPWVGTGMGDANFSNARSDPEPASSGYSDKRNLKGFVYHVWNDTHGWSGSKPLRGSNRNRTTGANGVVDLWDEHIRYTLSGGTLTKETITYSPTNNSIGETISSTTTINGSSEDTYGRTVAQSKQNIANWYQYYRKRAYVAKSAIAQVINNSPSFRYGLSVINDKDKLFKEFPDSADTPPFLTHNQDIIDSLLEFNWPAKGTPLRRGLELVGKYYDNEISNNPDTGSSMDDPIISSCQQNFSVLFTDGFWNGSDPDSTIADADGDGYSITVADVAMYYYTNDLSSSLADDLIGTSFDPAKYQHMVTFAVAFGVRGLLSDSDASGWPDSGGSDLLENEDWGEPDNSNPEKIDDLWHAAYNSKGKFVSASTPQDVIKALEDTFADIASRKSVSPDIELSSNIFTLDSLAFESTFDSETWSGDLIAYPVNADQTLGEATWKAATELDKKTYKNRVMLTYNKAKGIPFIWPKDFTSPTSDEMIISQTATTGLLTAVPGSYNNLQKQTYGENFINYLRGDDSNEGTTNIPRDSRTSKLGDIVHSDPFFVPKPRFFYPEDWVDLLNNSSGSNTTEPEDNVSYALFKAKYSDDSATVAIEGRSEMVYVGANDGMLHGFFAEKTSRNGHNPGEELIAYVPSMLFPKLSKLTAQPYDHFYFVDGSQVQVDVLLHDLHWHSVLVGSLGAGGQGIYALDITDPEKFTENNAADIVLWEFSDKDDSDLGYTFSRPSIIRLHNGQWAAVFGNGYNNTYNDSSDTIYSKDDDGTADTTTQGDEGQAVLYIVDIQTGNLIKKFETNVGISHSTSRNFPNGLSTPAVVDVNNDRIIDYLYAGDLYGNLWKFDINDTDVNNWEIAFNGKPLFTACTGICDDDNHQPITVQPEVFFHPKYPNDQMIFFGTGKYFELADNSASEEDTQTFYGIWDKGAGWTAFNRNNLLKQSITRELTVNYDSDGDGKDDTSADLRFVSDNKIDWNTHIGWYMDLYNTENGNTENYGERQVFDPEFDSGLIKFDTLLPPKSICDYVGGLWTMELDAYNGGVPDIGEGAIHPIDPITGKPIEIIDPITGQPIVGIPIGIKNKDPYSRGSGEGDTGGGDSRLGELFEKNNVRNFWNESL